MVKTSIQRRAEEAFAKHVLTEEAPGRFHCREPGNSIYAFHLVFVPYHVIMVGDLNDLVLRCSDADSLRWLRTCPNREYLLGKATRPDYVLPDGEPFRWLSSEEGTSYVGAAKRERLRDEWRTLAEELDGVKAWALAWYRVMSDEPPQIWTYSPQMHWQACALEWFVEAYRKHRAATLAPAPSCVNPAV